MYDIRLLISEINRRGNGSYMLILKEQNGQRELSIPISKSESYFDNKVVEHHSSKQAHDLLFELAKHFSIEALEVHLKKEKEIFYATIFYFDGDKTVELAARPSDAVAIAMRFRCPIFTSEEIIVSSGKKRSKNDYFSNLDKDELTDMLNFALEEEDYQKASIIRDELIKRDS